MLKIKFHILILLFIVQCIPASPTNSEFEDTINNYEINPPDNFTVTPYYSALQIDIDHKNTDNIDGYLFFLMEEGEPVETTVELIDKNTYRFLSNLHSIEPTQTYGIQSFKNMCPNTETNNMEQQTCKFLSDIKTSDFIIPFPFISISRVSNDLHVNVPIFKNQAILSLEYSADSVNFQDILTYQHTSNEFIISKNLIYSNFRDSFNNKLDGIFRFNLIQKNDVFPSDPTYRSTAESASSKCESQMPSKNIGLKIDNSHDFGSYAKLTWDLYDQCYDQILIYEIDQISGVENVVEMSFPSDTRSFFILDTEPLPLTFVVGGNRFGDKVYKSNTITIN